MTLRRAAVIVALALLTLAAPASSRAGESGSGAEPWERDVQGVLDARAEAVLERDREAFLATVDPEAPQRFREAQATLFDGLATVPFASYELEALTDDVSDLSRAVAGERDDADEIRLPLVEERHRIDGIDGIDAVSDFWYTFVRRGDRWFLNADDDLADLGLETQEHLWSFGPVTFVEGERSVVMHRPGGEERAQSLLDITEQAFDRLVQTLPWESPPKVLVVLPESTGQLEEMLQTNFDLTNFVAFATADVDRREEVGGWEWTAPRVFAQEQNLARHSLDFQIETLHHELVHVVAFDRAGPHIPNWLHEGHADYLALEQPRPSAVSGTDGDLPLDFQFITGGRDQILRSYRESTSAAAFLADAVGPDAPSELFAALGAVRMEPGTWEYHLDQQLREIYGEGLAEFEADWNGGRG